jgi:hypothetical protein
LIAACLFCAPSFGQSPPVNAELVGHWDGFDGSYADVWGDGNYAYIGSWGDPFVQIVDISDAANPGPAVEYALPPGAQGSAQDVKVGDDLLFISLEGGGSVGVHIVDVRDPTNPVGLVSIDIDGFNAIHNTFYDAGHLYIVDSGSTRIGVVDLTAFDPDNPPAGPITELKWLVTDVGSSFVHDITVQDGRMYACAWDSGLWIYDVTNVATEPPSFLGQTPDGGNNTHSAWATDNGDYVVTGEERTGGGIKVYRITDVGGGLELELTDTLELPTEQAFSVHNQTIVGYRLYNAWYGAGLQVLDIDPETGLLDFVASYDTSAGGLGNWGVYPFLGPDKVLASDESEGLFIIHVDPPAGPSPDLDNDGDVDAADLATLLGSWGPCADCEDCPADLNGDCIVDATDLATLLGNWG